MRSAFVNLILLQMKSCEVSRWLKVAFPLLQSFLDRWAAPKPNSF